ncbi:hypothetical protein LFM56_08670 [Cellulomonas iranensis]|uniref:hypothetical protein n=1 Tax=Cellulomonas iranensis TaxID=76862 RepID=UPI001CF16488|nr:hypothetical protein [Cellulomonas iranensis]UCN16342.1 hypothetical protein LFM56_08670 [Cellulomonas iranensis]
MKAQIAETGVWPGGGDIRVSPRYQQLRRARRDAEVYSKLTRTMADERATFAWMRANPWHALRMLFTIIRANVSRRLGWRDGVSDVDGESSENAAESLSAAMNLIDRGVAAQRQMVGAQAVVDRGFYRPAYLQSNPFVRLELKGFKYKPRHAADTTKGETFDSDATVTLVVHNSGVCLLTFILPLGDGLSTQDLLGYGQSRTCLLTETSVAESVLRYTVPKSVIRDDAFEGEWEREIRLGTRWRRAEWADPIELTELYHLYSRAIRLASGQKRAGDEYLCYTLTCVDRIACTCKSERSWMRKHRLDATAVILRTPSADKARTRALDELIPPNQALTKDHSLFLSVGNGLRIVWARGEGSRYDVNGHMWVKALLDHVLMQFGQLALLERLFEDRRDVVALRRTQRIAIGGLQEFRRSSMVFGTAITSAQALLDAMGVPRLHERLLERLGVLQQSVDARAAARAARRDIFISALGTLLAAVLGLGGIKEALSVVQAGPDSRFLHRYLHIDEHPNVASLALSLYVWMLAAIAAIGIAVLAFSAWRLIRRRKRTPSFGYAWPDSPGVGGDHA